MKALVPKSHPTAHLQKLPLALCRWNGHTAKVSILHERNVIDDGSCILVLLAREKRGSKFPEFIFENES